MNRRQLVLAVLAAGVLMVAAWQLPLGEWIDALEHGIIGLGAAGALAFVLLYIVTTVLLGPASALTLLAGLAYGFWGVPLVIIGATSGAAIAFLTGRHLARGRVQRAVNQRRQFRAINHAVAEEGWRMVGLLRLSPIIPFGLQNYFFSVSTIGFLPFILATAIGIVPGTVLYVYVGSLGKSSDTGPAQWALIGIGLVATIAVVWLVSRKARAVLARMDIEPTEP